MCLSGVACIGMIFPVLYGGSSLNWLTITLSMIGRFGNAAAFAIIYVFSAELFPTVMRNSGMGSSSFFARIGGMLSPYIADLGELVEGDVSLALPAMIFGVLSLAAGLLAFILPETRNRNLPETVEDAQNFGRETPGNLTSPEKYITGLDKMDKSDNGITLQAYNKPA
ncbi:organic cation transporter protein [Aplysia californica]|uniref:Organic cation transporter protein n=1 Tax=Aplysia californica TaxID=6500 RepID=A0ABM0ZZW4_APLCA|nr:organic cation transporter protein [Aplysia californica]